MTFLIRYSIIKKERKKYSSCFVYSKLYKMDSFCYLVQLKETQRRHYGCILKLIVSKVVTFIIKLFPHGQISLNFAFHLNKKGYFHRQLLLKTTRNYKEQISNYPSALFLKYPGAELNWDFVVKAQEEIATSRYLNKYMYLQKTENKRSLKIKSWNFTFCFFCAKFY